jgi:regulator of sigma E protease
MIIFTILFGLLGLGIIVFFHETGHFIAAKLCGVEVEIFSIGWGSKLIGFEYKGTTYQLSWFPIGGFCKMKGEHIGTNFSDEELEKVRNEKGTFFGASPWKKVLIALSGPLSNILFAVVVFTIILVIGFSYDSPGNRIVLAADYTFDEFTGPTPAELAGLKTGDRIVAINGQSIQNFEEIRQIVMRNANNTLIVTVLRENEQTGTVNKLEFHVTPQEAEYGIGRIGIRPWVEPVIDEVKMDMPETEYELKTEDRILNVNGKTINHTVDLYQFINDNYSGDNLELTLGIERAGEIIERNTIVVFDENKNAELDFNFKIKTYTSPGLNIIEALIKGFSDVYESFLLMLKAFAYLPHVKRIDEAVGGPVTIIHMIGDSAASGIQSFFNFLRIISIVVAFMNLLPIPVLDGGTIVVSLIEGIRRKPFSAKTLIRLQIIGSVIIFLLIILAIFSDVFRYLI